MEKFNLKLVMRIRESEPARASNGGYSLALFFKFYF